MDLTVFSPQPESFALFKEIQIALFLDHENVNGTYDGVILAY